MKRYLKVPVSMVFGIPIIPSYSAVPAFHFSKIPVFSKTEKHGGAVNAMFVAVLCDIYKKKLTFLSWQ